jgi:outer membrane protein assembly factor BamE (lipoprotein component of BamABCDE complex)
MGEGMRRGKPVKQYLFDDRPWDYVSTIREEYCDPAKPMIVERTGIMELTWIKPPARARHDLKWKLKRRAMRLHQRAVRQKLAMAG